MLIIDIKGMTILLHVTEARVTKILMRPNYLHVIFFCDAGKQRHDKGLPVVKLLARRPDADAAGIEVERARHIIADLRDRANQPDLFAGGDKLVDYPF